MKKFLCECAHVDMYIYASFSEGCFIFIFHVFYVQSVRNEKYIN
jgi:hypothetical protein